MSGRSLPALDWTASDDPWYRVGVWCVIYGAIVGAPTLSMALLLGLFAVLGGPAPNGEFYWLLGVGTVAGTVAAGGLLLIRYSRRAQQERRALDESYWF